MVNHSHSCGPVPAPATPFGPPIDIPFGGPPIPPIPAIPIPPGPIGLVVIPNPLASPMFVMLPPPVPIMPMPNGFAASFEPVEFSGESMSMVSIALTLLLCRLCRFGATATFARGALDAAAPGPGVAFRGAAAIGTTPLPPLIVVVPPIEEPADP